MFAAALPLLAITIGALRAVGVSTAIWIAVAVGIDLSLVSLIVLVKVVVRH